MEELLQELCSWRRGSGIDGNVQAARTVGSALAVGRNLDVIVEKGQLCLIRAGDKAGVMLPGKCE
jgi:hypothetical protein